MPFHSATFLLGFLPLAVLAFFLVGRLAGRVAAAGVLVASSLVFYAWSHPWHLAVLLLSVAGNYALADAILRRPPNARSRRTLLAVGVTANLLVLGWFKYAVFAASTLEGLGGPHLGWAAVVLPLGLSFITFQKIGYLAAAARGDFKKQDPAGYAVFVTFFPQLIAGPISHHWEILPQIADEGFGRWHGGRAAAGAALFAAGAAKKLILADGLAHHADAVFGAFASGASPALGAAEAWAGLLAFSFQIYFDFSGYCDMAMGLGLAFGVVLPENFLSPYRACSISEFWRRWHATLSRFLREQVYIPLGGSRSGVSRTVLALMLTMLLGGLWHGAAWTFVIWGGLHGTLLVIHHAWRRVGRPLPRWLGWTLTFAAVVATFPFFRCDGWPSLGRAWESLLGAHGAWGAAEGGLAGWLAAQRPLEDLVPIQRALEFTGLYPSPTPGAFYLPDLLLSEWTGRIVILALAAGWACIGPRALLLFWDPVNGAPRLDAKRGILAGVLAALSLLAAFSPVLTPFIYFRF